MNFNSLAFFLFFAAIWTVYWLLRNRLKTQNLFLLAASLFFYGYWDWRFVSLIVFTAVSTWWLALRASRALPDRHRAKLWTAACVSLNVVVLGIFKYFNFFSDQFRRLTLHFFPDTDWITLSILLPVGISFYTFQAIGYAIDVYRGKIRPEGRISDFALFLCYFPQLVAGPIESASALLPQLKRSRAWNYAEQSEGLRRILWGLAKKVIIADRCSDFVNHLRFYGDGSITDMTLLALFFTIQIYCDFSGYCDIALGASRCLGIRLSENFRTPYFSTNIQDFWRRWNISLMRWFKEYLYIPLGGSRRGLTRTLLNIMIVFLVSGLWHGASLHFILWGAYWGVLMVAYRLVRQWKWFNFPAWAAVPFTFFWASLGWTLFVATDTIYALRLAAGAAPGLLLLTVGMAALIRICTSLHITMRRFFNAFIIGCLLLCVAAHFSIELLAFIGDWYILAFIAAILGAEWETCHLEFALKSMPDRALVRYPTYWIFVILIIICQNDNTPFIYFQF